MKKLKEVWIMYRNEPEGWWAESEDLPGWTAAGSSFEEVRAMALEGVREFAGEEVLIREEVPSKTQASGATLLHKSDAPVSSSHGGTVAFEVSIYVVPQFERRLPGIGQGRLESDESLPLLPQVVQSA